MTMPFGTKSNLHYDLFLLTISTAWNFFVSLLAEYEDIVPVFLIVWFTEGRLFGRILSLMNQD